MNTYEAQYIAARVALEHAVELAAIINDHTKDDPAKIEEARQGLFGLPCVAAPPPSYLLPPKCQPPQNHS